MSRQTFADFEVLIFDDGSSDDSVEVVEKAALADNRMRLTGSERVGLIEALVRLVKSSGSEFIARMDADDISHPKRLEKQVGFLDVRRDVSLVGSLIRCIPPSAVDRGMKRYEAWQNSLIEPDEIARDIFVESPLCHPSVLMRRRAYENAGGYADDGFPEDYGLWLKFFNSGLKMSKVQRALLFWRESSTRLTRTDERYAPERFFSLKLRELLSGPLKSTRSVAVWGAGPTGKKWGRALRNAGLDLVEFVDVDAKKVGRTLLEVPIVPHESLRRGLPADILIAAVGSRGARERIRIFLADLGCRELCNFICVA